MIRLSRTFLAVPAGPGAAAASLAGRAPAHGTSRAVASTLAADACTARNGTTPTLHVHVPELPATAGQ